MTDRRSQIVDAAAHLISHQGYASTSVEDVIRESRLSGKSHFYHYFKSKEELGYAVLNRQFERFAERGLAILREPMIDPLERLVLFIDTLVALQVARGCTGGSFFGTLAAELADAHEGFRKRIEVVFARWSAQLQSLLWEARPQLHDEVDTGRLARFVIATLEGAMLVARVDRDADALRAIAYDLKRFVAMHVREPAVVLGAGAGGGVGAASVIPAPPAAPPAAPRDASPDLAVMSARG
ncbi:TetR/AcrR family transcriptional regulator [Roseisolibacter sp. H3M3-2]|uniref:TetR/AcrR family transcriptional regulator n=1 Tax=Roseisolibacter sp. H3M3-2 TaxID=3031323 RepID=UPI0023DC5F7A|nr:TetR/AcrR family transcriptional regulator [Roseisolibacter sp. H3M3-2]MDF1503570.1 TetR family transcriptional regulator C-terminal domain-containing protein [Roseisolibacter sp. H3M3-2]